MRRLVVGSAILALTAATLSWTWADDQEIARKVAERLKQEQKEGNLRGFDINLKVAEGKVTLKGDVSSDQQKDLAVTATSEVEGVKVVVNDLQVKAQADLSDAEGADSTAGPQPAKKSLLSGLLSGEANKKSADAGSHPAKAKPSDAEPTTPALTASELDQATSSGTTDTKQAAEDRRIGAELTQRLQELKASGQLHGFGIAVHVENGCVWLKGRVGSSDQQRTALDLAQRTRGVRQVVNELSVGEPPAAIAQKLGDRLRSAEADGTLRGAHLNVKVDGPDVWLTGSVNTPEQEQSAVELARQVPGVRRVISGVNVRGIGAASQPATTVSDASREPASNLAFTTRSTATLSAPARTQLVAAEVVPATPANSSPQPISRPVTVPMLAVDQTPRPLAPPQLGVFAGAMAAAPLAAVAGAAGMMPAQLPGPGYAVVPARYDHPSLPGYAWPSYAAYPNYAAVTYPRQYSASAWPYIGPFYPYPQVPLGWRKVTLKWDDGWWNLDFKAK